MTVLKERPPRTVSVAPMLDWTTDAYRFFARQITQKTWLYSEMVTTGALIYGDVAKHLDFHDCTHPIALQLGGSEPKDLAHCVQLAAKWGYDEVNINVGCPSERVQKGAFGACLMAEPDLVADCVYAMKQAALACDNAPDITVKNRIGINDVDSYEALLSFVETVASAGCGTFIIHARNAILKGLSPKENREIPPLNYDYVYRLKAERPDLEIILNGGVKTNAEINAHLQHVDGVMLGREAYHNPWLMQDWDALYYGQAPATRTRQDVALAMMPFIKAELTKGHHLRHVTRHILGLFQGEMGARLWRRMLSDAETLKGADETLILQAMPSVPSPASFSR